MYKELEELYKKKNPYNKIKIKSFWLYIFVVLFLYIFNKVNNIWLMTFVAIISIFIFVKLICEKELKTKLHLRIGKKQLNEKSLNEIINEKEYLMFKKYVKDNEMYNDKALLLIINHYRNNVRMKISGENLIGIISIAISIILPFMTKQGFDFDNFSNTLPYIFSLIFIIVICYVSFKSMNDIKSFFKGEDGMQERFETIFSQLYIECLGEESKSLNKKIKKSRKEKAKLITKKMK